jgi:hypothetical protein
MQLPFAGMVAPERVTLLVGAESVPPQPEEAAGELFTVKLLGNVAFNPTEVSAYAFELPSVMVSVELPFCPTLAGAKASDTVGGFGLLTVSIAWLAAALPPAGPVMSAFAATALV